MSARIKRIRRQQLENELLPIDQLRDLMARCARHLRNAGEQLAKHHGEGARSILDKAMAAFKKELQSLPTDRYPPEAPPKK